MRCSGLPLPSAARVRGGERQEPNGGYIGMTGLTYEPKVDRAILLFSGRTDGDAGIAISLYRAYCLSDARADQRADPNSGYIP